VKVSLRDGTHHEDVGYGMSENKNKGEAIEKAKKEAVSDARKRALRLFGNALGNSVYDREYTTTAAKAPKSTKRVQITFEALRSSLADSEAAAEASFVSQQQRVPGQSGSVQGGLGGGIPKQSPQMRSPAPRGGAGNPNALSPQPPQQQHHNNYGNPQTRSPNPSHAAASSGARSGQGVQPTNQYQQQQQPQSSAQRYGPPVPLKNENEQYPNQQAQHTDEEATTEYFAFTEDDGAIPELSFHVLPLFRNLLVRVLCFGLQIVHMWPLWKEWRQLVQMEISTTLLKLKTSSISNILKVEGNSTNNMRQRRKKRTLIQRFLATLKSLLLQNIKRLESEAISKVQLLLRSLWKNFV
jgi:hypothetical protein